jgi:hypothetical protein
MKFIREWIKQSRIMSMLEANQQRMNILGNASPQIATEMERMFGNVSPAVVAFKIENGFVVRTVSQAELYEGKRQSGFHYCKVPPSVNRTSYCYHLKNAS